MRPWVHGPRAFAFCLSITCFGVYCVLGSLLALPAQVVTWGHSPNSFVVVTGNMLKQVKIYFKTDQGKEMNQVVLSYVEHLLELQKGK